MKNGPVDRLDLAPEPQPMNPTGDDVHLLLVAPSVRDRCVRYAIHVDVLHHVVVDEQDAPAAGARKKGTDERTGAARSDHRDGHARKVRQGTPTGQGQRPIIRGRRWRWGRLGPTVKR